MLLRGIRRAAALRGFLTHILIFLTGMIILNLTDAGLEYVPLAAGWLLGLLLHGISVFGPGQLLGESWEERQLQNLIASRDFASTNRGPNFQPEAVNGVHSTVDLSFAPRVAAAHVKPFAGAELGSRTPG